MYYYFEKIHPNTVKEALEQIEIIEQGPPKKKIKRSLEPLDHLEKDSLIEEICQNEMPTFTQSPISINTQQNFFIHNPNCFQPIIKKFNLQKPVIKQEIEIIEKIPPYFYKDLTYIDFFNYDYNKIYLTKKCSFCKIEKSDVKFDYLLYNFEMFKFELGEENSAWYIKMTNNLTNEIKKFICIRNQIN